MGEPVRRERRCPRAGRSVIRRAVALRLCRALIRQHYGGEGWVGDHYLVLFRAGELVEFNRDYEVAEYAPGLILFGSTGGGEGYAFDARSAGLPIVQVPLIGMSREDATPLAPDVTRLFQRLRGDR